MQILAGKYKGKRLQSAESSDVRPTARRLRESLFEIVGRRLNDARFLDLCSGSGAVGIEALSRGARHTTFVDHSLTMCDFVHTNLELCGVPDEQFEVVKDDASHFVQSIDENNEGSWDILFFDPPYAGDYQSVINPISTGTVLRKKRSVLVVEHGVEIEMNDVIERLHRWRVVRQGESCLSFYERKK